MGSSDPDFLGDSMSLRAIWLFFPGVFLISLGSARAQADAAKLPDVQILSLHDPDAFNVAESSALVQIFDAIPAPDRDKIRLSFYVQRRDGGALPNNLQIAITTTTAEQPLKLLSSGELDLAALSTTEAAGAEITTNVRRGTLRIVYFVQPRLTEKPMTLGYLRHALIQARGAWSKLYGPLTGWTVPAFTCAKARYAYPSVVTLWSAPGTALWRSEPAEIVTVPINQRDFRDELLIDWGPVIPGRIGGCVENNRSSEQ